MDIIQTFFWITIEELMLQESLDHKIPTARQRNSKYDSKKDQKSNIKLRSYYHMF